MLTFVVPTIPGRESLLSRCLWSIMSQGGSALVVEGDGALGDKVNAAAEHVDTPYMTIVDDDDYLSAAYVATVTPRLGLVHYVGFKVLELNRGRYENISSTIGDYPAWGVHKRGPVPKGVTRTDIFREVEFGNDYRADRTWSNRVRALVELHAFENHVLYIHDWWPHEFGEAAGRDVGTWPHRDVPRIEVGL